MMSPEREIRVSKFLSKHLRHEPERLGLTLEPGGWVGVNALLEACARHRFPISRDELDHVVQNNPKKRFAYDDSESKIRAQQGHSVEIDLELQPSDPPPLLFHGTPERNIDVIQRDGLLRMNRHHVHLSPDRETARIVGMRRGRPAIFVIDAQGMCSDGFTFYQSGNGVWLVDAVPPRYLRLE